MGPVWDQIDVTGNVLVGDAVEHVVDDGDGIVMLICYHWL